MTTFATLDRAVGDFAVTVMLVVGLRVKGQGDDEPGPDRLQQRYGNPKKPAASVHIAAETAELAAIDLKPRKRNPTERPDPKPVMEQ